MDFKLLAGAHFQTNNTCRHSPFSTYTQGSVLHLFSIVIVAFQVCCGCRQGVFVLLLSLCVSCTFVIREKKVLL
jgi:hypothetical protein